MRVGTELTPSFSRGCKSFLGVAAGTIALGVSTNGLLLALGLDAGARGIVACMGSGEMDRSGRAPKERACGALKAFAEFTTCALAVSGTGDDFLAGSVCRLGKGDPAPEARSGAADVWRPSLQAKELGASPPAAASPPPQAEQGMCRIPGVGSTSSHVRSLGLVFGLVEGRLGVSQGSKGDMLGMPCVRGEASGLIEPPGLRVMGVLTPCPTTWHGFIKGRLFALRQATCVRVPAAQGDDAGNSN